MHYRHAVESLADLNPAALTADGLEQALIGFTSGHFRPALAVYDVERCLRILERRDQMTPEQAMEFFSFNTASAWAGEGTPLYLHPITRRKRP